MSDYEIVVVTKVDEPSGNLAMAFDLWWATGETDEKTYLPEAIPFVDALKKMLPEQMAGNFLLSMREPVFRVGEILILDDGGREIGYPGRKPSKWLIEVTTVETLEEAAAVAERAMNPEAVEEQEAVESIKRSLQEEA